MKVTSFEISKKLSEIGFKAPYSFVSFVGGGVGNMLNKLWNAIHKKPEEKFEASPFVWVVCFEVINN